MGKQIQIIATVDEVLDIIETAKQWFPELYVWEKILVGPPHPYVSVQLKSSSIDESKVRRAYDPTGEFNSIQLCSSSDGLDNGHYMYGRIYMMSSGWQYTEDGTVPEEQNTELVKIYNYMVNIIKKKCTRRYGNIPFIVYALPEADKVYYPIHVILKQPVYMPNRSAKK